MATSPFLPALVIALSISQAFAQDLDKKLRVGPTVGINLARTANPVYTTTGKPGFNAGVKASYPLGRRVRLDGLLIYTEKGAQDDQWKEYYNYVEVPVLMRYEFGNSTKIYPMIGMYQAFLTSAYLATGSLPKSPLAKGDEGAHRYELGINFGVGSQVNLTSTTALFLDFRCSSGLTNVLKTGDSLFSRDGGSSVRTRNVVFSLNTGVLF